MHTLGKTLAVSATALALLVVGCKKSDDATQGTSGTTQQTAQQGQNPGNAPANTNPGTFAGDTRVAPVPNSATLLVPRILWGGEMPAFYANGGNDKTQANSIFAEQGLNVQFTPGDDFGKQVADYKAGKTPFLRGTLHMIGLASEELGRDERTRPVVVTQLTWSAGDHMVCRDSVKTLTDLRGKKVVLQTKGPHMGLLDDALRTANIGWNDVNVQYVNDITGPNGPAEAFKRDAGIACAFAVTPDAVTLVGGDLTKTGNGAEGTVQGAHLVVSTRELSRSIADVYAVRHDWYEANKATVTKFVAGYLKGVEEVLQLKHDYATNGPNKAKYVAKVLKPAEAIFGSSALPTDDDADGLLSDAQFVGYQGNIEFFAAGNNPVGFNAMNERAVNLAVDRGFARTKIPLLPSSLEWHSTAFTGYLGATNVASNGKFNTDRARSDIEDMTRKGTVDSHTIYAFTISFDPGQTGFNAAQYHNEFQRVLELSRMYGGAIIAIRGHADPTMTLKTLVDAGCSNGTLVCKPELKQYFYKGNALNLLDTRHIVELVQSGEFDRGVQVTPRQVMQEASNLSLKRADSVRDELVKFGDEAKVKIDKTQIQAQGVGVLEPIVPKPSNAAEAARNQRVEFRIIRVSAEATKTNDFDF